jgi:hypothetical protein
MPTPIVTGVISRRGASADGSGAQEAAPTTAQAAAVHNTARPAGFFLPTFEQLALTTS